MYKLSYEKCVVCFLFLVMVAFLSCSGFRIDNNHLSFNQQNNNNFSSSMNFLIFNESESIKEEVKTNSVDSNILITSSKSVVERRTRWYRDTQRFRRTRHRIRHSKHSQSQVQVQQQEIQVEPTSRIDVFVKMPSVNDELQRLSMTHTTSTTHTHTPLLPAYSHPLQPTETLGHTKSTSKRSQRSPPFHGHQQYQQQHHHQTNTNRNHLINAKKNKNCQEQNLARKAYMANTVVLAKAESMSSNRVRNYSVSFRIMKRFKTPDYAIVDDILRLTFMNDTKRMNCESELFGGAYGVVKAQIKQSKEYYLFLNSQGNHNYTVVGTPVLNRRKKHYEIEKILSNVTRRNFEPRLKKPELIKKLEQKTKVRMICKAKGYPIPVIAWKKNETFLHTNSNIRITYLGRKSTLVIKRAEDRDSGRYTCIAKGVDGHEIEDSTELRISNSNSHEEKCEDNRFCLNGGTCKYNTDLKEHYCLCSDGYTGSRCAQKTIGDLTQMQSKFNKCEMHGVPASSCDFY